MTDNFIQDKRRRGFLGSAGALLATAAWPVSASAMTAEAALNLADDRRDELMDLLSALVRVQSLSGETAAEAQAVVRQYLAALPYRIEESADRPSRYTNHEEYMHPNPPGDGPFVNLVGWPEKKAARQFAVFSHIDTHMIAEGWDSQPLQPRIVGNRMYGLGTSDDKGGIAAMLIAAAALAEAGAALPIVMSLHGKGGGSRGSLPVFARIREQDHRIGAVLYAHPAETGRGLNDIKNEVQGVFDLELRVTGWRAPPMEIGSVDSSPWAEGGNALDMCWSAFEHLRETVYAGQLLNLGIMEGGDRMGAVATDAVASFRLKFPGPSSWKSLLADGNASLAEFRRRLSGENERFQFELVPAGYRTNPGKAAWDAEESRILRGSIRDVTGRAPDAYPNHYAGDIRYPIRLLDVPAYGIGSLGGNFYGPNEWVDLDDLVKLVAVLIQTLSGWSEL